MAEAYSPLEDKEGPLSKLRKTIKKIRAKHKKKVGPTKAINNSRVEEEYEVPKEVFRVMNRKGERFKRTSKPHSRWGRFFKGRWVEGELGGNYFDR